MELDLRAYRKRNNLTQEALGKELNLAKSTISMIESNARNLPEEAVVLFRALLAKEMLTALPSAAADPLSLASLQQHMGAMGQGALWKYQKKCEFELNAKQAKLFRWKDHYQNAMAKYMLAEGAVSTWHGREAEAPAGYLGKLQEKKVKALQALLAVGEQKPSLTIVKIAGLQEELRKLAEMMKASGDSVEWMTLPS